MESDDEPGKTLSSPKTVVDSRVRAPSVLEKLRLRSKTQVERDPDRPFLDFGSLAQGELLGLSISLRIPFTQTGAGRNGTMKLFYIIRCTMAPPEGAPSKTPAKSWEVAKKYSDFVRLDKTIKETLMKSFSSVEGAYGLAVLPPRHLLTSDYDDSLIAERKHGFLRYLQSALTASFFFEDIQAILASFLECPGALKNGRLLRHDTSNEVEEEGLKPVDGTALLTNTVLGEAQHGFLHKHAGPGQLFKPFKLVFCVLNFAEGVFRYYKPENPVLLGEFKVKGVYGKAYIVEAKQFSVPSNGFGFMIWTPVREMIFYAESNEDRNQWLQSFRSLLSAAVPAGLAELPVISPRPQTVDTDLAELSSGSLIFSQESRRLSSAHSDVRSNSMTEVPIPRKSRTSSIEPDPNMTSPVITKPSRGNSTLEAVHEGVTLESRPRLRSASATHDRLEPRAAPPAVIVAGNPPPSQGSLTSATRDAIYASQQRRSRGASDHVHIPGAEAAVAAAAVSAAMALGGKQEHGGSKSRSPLRSPPRSPTRTRSPLLLHEGQSSPMRRRVHSGSTSPSRKREVDEKEAEPGRGGGGVEVETIPTAAHRPSNTPGDRPRFPSNISIISDGRALFDESSIRPPSDSDQASPGMQSSPSRGRKMPVRESTSSFLRLPPPRFPSNLRIASSGGSSVASPAMRQRKASAKSKPHPFRLFHAPSSTRSLDVVQDDASSGELFSRALVRLKVDTLPCRNPHVLLGLMAMPDPWKGRAVGLMTAHQFSACMENIYFDVHSLRKSAAFRPRPNDVIVTSVARSGATPILFALDSLRSGCVTSLEELPWRVPWVEGKELAHEPTKMPVTPIDASSMRLLKTTMPVRYCLGIAGGHAINANSPKVVVVLRDPLDVRLSWYRHCRRVHRKCCKKGRNFDEKFDLEDFAQVPIPSCNPTFSAAMSPNETYEVYLREVLQIHEAGKGLGHFHIVFYEEFIADCENTIRKLAEFISPNADEALIRQIVDALQDSPDFPGTANEETGRLRIGSTGQGCREFSRYDIEQIDNDWDKIVKSHFPHYEQYSKIYEAMLGLPYPHPRTKPFDEELAKAKRRSSGLNALALLQPGRRSLMELKVSKFVQRRLTNSNGSAYHTNGGDETKAKKRIDPDDTDDEQ